MAEATGRAPIKRITSGSLVLKIWEQPGGEKGKPFLTTTVGRTWKDKETGEFRESRSLTQNEVDKLPTVSLEASQFIRAWETRQREQSRQQEAQERLPLDGASPSTAGTQQASPADQQNGLKAWRDQAMAGAKAPGADTSHSPNIGPEQ